jgi:hypothetical protein
VITIKLDVEDYMDFSSNFSVTADEVALLVNPSPIANASNDAVLIA